MIHFVIPFKSARVSDSWETVCQLLDRTLRSLTNQRSAAYTIVLVCHETPPNLIAGSGPSSIGRDRFDIVNVAFDPPPRSGDRAAIYATQERDKYRKMQIGLQYVVERGPGPGEPDGHIMFVDADDLISNRIAGFVAAHPDANGWYVDRGYTLRADQGRILPRSGLHLRTNTSHIVALPLLAAELALPADRLAGDHSALVHRNVKGLLAERGTHLEPLPFPGTIYVTHNGQNMWAERGRMVGSETPGAVLKQTLGFARYWLRGRTIPTAVSAEFGLT